MFATLCSIDGVAAILLEGFSNTSCGTFPYSGIGLTISDSHADLLQARSTGGLRIGSVLRHGILCGIGPNQRYGNRHISGWLRCVSRLNSQILSVYQHFIPCDSTSRLLPVCNKGGQALLESLSLRRSIRFISWKDTEALVIG